MFIPSPRNNVVVAHYRAKQVVVDLDFTDIVVIVLTYKYHPCVLASTNDDEQLMASLNSSY